MKVEINNKEQNTEIKFPCLMEGTNETLYLIDGLSSCGNYYQGMLLKSKGYDIYYSDGLDKKSLTPFNNSITLSNE